MKPIDIEFTEYKSGPEKIDENIIDFRWSDVQGEDEEHNAKANFIISKKASSLGNLSKK